MTALIWTFRRLSDALYVLGDIAEWLATKARKPANHLALRTWDNGRAIAPEDQRDDGSDGDDLR